MGVKGNLHRTHLLKPVFESTKTFNQSFMTQFQIYQVTPVVTGTAVISTEGPATTLSGLSLLLGSS